MWGVQFSERAICLTLVETADASCVEHVVSLFFWRVTLFCESRFFSCRPFSVRRFLVSLLGVRFFFVMCASCACFRSFARLSLGSRLAARILDVLVTDCTSTDGLRQDFHDVRPRCRDGEPSEPERPKVVRPPRSGAPRVGVPVR